MCVCTCGILYVDNIIISRLQYLSYNISVTISDNHETRNHTSQVYLSYLSDNM